MGFRKVATLDELWEGEMRALTIEEHVVLLIHLIGGIYAYADSCPHLGTKLSQGSLRRNVLSCATHGWEFDVISGQGINPKMACLESFAVKVEDGDIFIDVEARELRG